MGMELPALGGFFNFSINITLFYAYFGQNSYFKLKNNNLSIKNVFNQSKRTK